VGKSICALALGCKLWVLNIAKDHANIAYNDELTIKIEELLKDANTFDILMGIIELSF
jgi:hypothetical protein